MSQDRQYRAKLRRVVETSDCAGQVEKLLKKYKRFKEIYMSIRRDLSEYAHDNPNAYYGFAWKNTAPLYGLPSFYYCYKCDNGTVWLHEIGESNDS